MTSKKASRKRVGMNSLIMLEGMPEWIKIEKTKDVYFKADDWHNKVRLQFAVNMPFTMEFMVDLSKKEAEQLAQQLLNASKECE